MLFFYLGNSATYDLHLGKQRHRDRDEAAGRNVVNWSTHASEGFLGPRLFCRMPR